MTTLARSCKVKSVLIGSWELTSSLDTLFAQTGKNEYYRKNIAVSDVPKLILGKQTSVTKIPSHGVFETLLEFDSSLFEQSYDSYGVKVVYADVDVDIEVYDSLGRKKGSNFSIVSVTDLESPLHIVFKYTQLPNNVALDLYGVTGNTISNGGLEVESVTFGFVKSST